MIIMFGITIINFYLRISQNLNDGEFSVSHLTFAYFTTILPIESQNLGNYNSPNNISLLLLCSTITLVSPSDVFDTMDVLLAYVFIHCQTSKYCNFGIVDCQLPPNVLHIFCFFFVLLAVQREWPEVVIWRDDDQNSHAEPPIGLGKISEQKGILGPGPADLRFPEAL